MLGGRAPYILRSRLPLLWQRGRAPPYILKGVPPLAYHFISIILWASPIIDGEAPPRKKWADPIKL